MGRAAASESGEAAEGVDEGTSLEPPEAPSSGFSAPPPEGGSVSTRSPSTGPSRAVANPSASRYAASECGAAKGGRSRPATWRKSKSRRSGSSRRDREEEEEEEAARREPLRPPGKEAWTTSDARWRSCSGEWGVHQRGRGGGRGDVGGGARNASRVPNKITGAGRSPRCGSRRAREPVGRDAGEGAFRGGGAGSRRTWSVSARSNDAGSTFMTSSSSAPTMVVTSRGASLAAAAAASRPSSASFVARGGTPASRPRGGPTRRGAGCARASDRARPRARSRAAREGAPARGPAPSDRAAREASQHDAGVIAAGGRYEKKMRRGRRRKKPNETSRLAARFLRAATTPRTRAARREARGPGGGNSRRARPERDARSGTRSRRAGRATDKGARVTCAARLVRSVKTPTLFGGADNNAGPPRGRSDGRFLS